MELTEYFVRVETAKASIGYSQRLLYSYAESLRHIGMDYLSKSMMDIANDLGKSVTMVDTAGKQYVKAEFERSMTSFGDMISAAADISEDEDESE